jgi:hypothetical protein
MLVCANLARPFWRDGHEAARVHRGSRRRGGVANRSPRAAGNTYRGLPDQRFAPRHRILDRTVSQRPPSGERPGRCDTTCIHGPARLTGELVVKLFGANRPVWINQPLVTCTDGLT